MFFLPSFSRTLKCWSPKSWKSYVGVWNSLTCSNKGTYAPRTLMWNAPRLAGCLITVFWNKLNIYAGIRLEFMGEILCFFAPQLRKKISGKSNINSRIMLLVFNVLGSVFLSSNDREGEYFLSFSFFSSSSFSFTIKVTQTLSPLSLSLSLSLSFSLALSLALSLSLPLSLSLCLCLSHGENKPYTQSPSGVELWVRDSH